MTDKHRDRLKDGKEKASHIAIPEVIDIDLTNPIRGNINLGKIASWDDHLTVLGFPDGRPLWDLNSDRLSDLLPIDDTANVNRLYRKGRDNLAKAAANELWELTHSENENFVPTLEPDVRDWSPFVIKANYHGWARRLAHKYGLQDHIASQNGEQRQELNAFRHAATAAVFTIKYGANTALVLGTINELITESGAMLERHMDENEIADCNADLLNNRVGIKIAGRLRGNKSERKEISLSEVTDEVVRELRLGTLITKPLENWRQGNFAPELKLLFGKPDELRMNQAD